MAIMHREYSIAAARDNLASIVHEVEAGHQATLTRRGKPVAVILSLQEYERLSRPGTFLAAYASWRDTWGEALEEPDLEGLRDSSSGRDPGL